MSTTSQSDAAVAEEPPDASESRSDETIEFTRADRWALAATMVSIAVAAFVFWREAETEPFHIDELRQVRPYARDFQSLLDGSFAQEQPPLDVIVGARFQQLVGVGDVLQRGHSMIAGVVALVCLAVLLWRHRVRIGIPVAMLVLAFSPVFLSYTAYARPYALPLALMLGFLLAADSWLERGRWWSGAAIVVIAGLLPLSRVFEPPAFLVLASATVLIFSRRRPAWGRRVWLPVGASAGALVLVEIPVYLRLQSRLTAYQGDGSSSVGDQWQRIIDDSLPRLGDAFVDGWLALALVVGALAMPQVRSRLASLWWFWPLLLSPVAFFLAFHVRTQPGQPFFDRYGYFWLPPFAVVVGLLVERIAATVSDGNRSRPRVALAGLLAAVLAVYGFQLVASTVDDLGTAERPDYRSLGVEVESRVPVTTNLVFDSVGIGFGSYRPGYAGYGRYTSPLRRVDAAQALVSRPGGIEGVEEYVIATSGPVLDVDGWEAMPTSENMTLYLPLTPRSGVADLAADLVRFGEAAEVRFGAMFRLAGAQLLFNSGNADEGCAEIERLLDEAPALTGAVEAMLNRSPNAEDALRCVADLSG